MADVLVVDDDVDSAEVLADVLQAEGHEVRVARNGEEGLAALAAHHPELVLLDVEMPVLTGPEMAYQMLIRDCGLETIPIVLLSGVMDLASVASSVNTPYFLPKPTTLDELRGVISQALRERVAPGRAIPRTGAT